MLNFSTLSTRTVQFVWDKSGCSFVTPAGSFYTSFDSVYTSKSTAFCVSKSYLKTFLSTLRNLDFGINAGYFSILHVKGIGFRVYRSTLLHSLYLFLGFNHITQYCVDKAISFKPLKTHILLFSTDRAKFGTAIYQIRHLRFPDPYRGKGIRYRYQLMKFKPGKQR